MERYFFDVDDGHEVFADSEGSEYSGVATARQHALELLAETAGDVVPGSISDELSIAVTLKNAAGDELVSAVLRLEVRLDPCGSE